MGQKRSKSWWRNTWMPPKHSHFYEVKFKLFLHFEGHFHISTRHVQYVFCENSGIWNMNFPSKIITTQCVQDSMEKSHQISQVVNWVRVTITKCTKQTIVVVVNNWNIVYKKEEFLTFVHVFTKQLYKSKALAISVLIFHWKHFTHQKYWYI